MKKFKRFIKKTFETIADLDLETKEDILNLIAENVNPIIQLIKNNKVIKEYDFKMDIPDEEVEEWEETQTDDERLEWNKKYTFPHYISIGKEAKILNADKIMFYTFTEVCEGSRLDMSELDKLLESPETNPDKQWEIMVEFFDIHVKKNQIFNASFVITIDDTKDPPLIFQIIDPVKDSPTKTDIIPCFIENPVKYEEFEL
jgi:hypothetical protein